VTIYGVADAYMGFGSHGDNDKAAVNSGGLSGSRLGFRGVEDLGNGLKGVFTVEQGFDISNGTGMGNASRQAFVGLGGSFGTVSLGRQYAPGYDFQYDVTASASIGPQSILSNQSGMTITPNSGARWDNSVAYNGSFSGLKVRAIYGMGGNEDSYEAPTTATIVGDKVVLSGSKLMDPQDDDRFGLGVEYGNGPLKVGAVYHYLKDSVDINGLSDDQQEWLVGGSYNFGMLTLAGSYQEVEGIGNLKGVDADLWQIGVLVPVGAAGNVHLAYGEVDFDINAMGVNESAKAKSYTLAYTHALSKRTTAYAGWNRTDNDNGLDLGLVDYIQPAGATTYGGDESDLFFVGMRHTF
jgi:predicted porin